MEKSEEKCECNLCVLMREIEELKKENGELSARCWNFQHEVEKNHKYCAKLIKLEKENEELSNDKLELKENRDYWVEECEHCEKEKDNLVKQIQELLTEAEIREKIPKTEKLEKKLLLRDKRIEELKVQLLEYYKIVGELNKLNSETYSLIY